MQNTKFDFDTAWQRSFWPKHFESTCDGALQFKARKYGRERLLMARKRILWH